MTFLKRAYIHTTRKKAKTILLFFILLTVSTLILICLAIQSATKTSALNIRKSLMGSFTVNAKQLPAQLKDSVVKKILTTDGLTSNYNLRSYYQAQYQDSDGEPLTITTDGALEIPAGYEHAGKVVSNTHSDLDSYFTEAGFELVDGRHITAGDSNVILIHEDLAASNHLVVGDHLILAAAGTENERTQDVAIIGIFTNTLAQDAFGMVPSYDLYENVSFTDNATYSQLYFTDETQHYQYGDFYVSDPAELDMVIAEVRDISGMDWDDCVFSKHDAEYQNAKSSLESLQGLVTTVIAVLIMFSVVLLTLILGLWMKSRVHETGVLLAMGLGKGTVLLQYLSEMILIAVAAFALSFGAGTVLAQSVGNRVLLQISQGQVSAADLTGNSAEEAATKELFSLNSVEIKVSLSDLLYVYVIGTGIIVLSVLLAAGSVMRMKPKDILAKMS